MANIINAIINLVENPKFKLKQYSSSHNRANSMGEALEEYIKDLFAGTVKETDITKRNEKLSKVFSYLGNQNNPPDSMLLGGDAIEVKKIESDNSSLALNSSCPKAKLDVDNPMIKQACRDCESWETKDMIYAVGIVSENDLKALTFVYGDDYCAEKDTYEQIKTAIKTGVESISGVEFSNTKELGRVNRVDPLGVTYLRVRGMWGIENPFNVFDYVFRRNNNKSFNFMCIINSEKYNSFDNRQELEKLCDKVESLDIKDVKIKNPNNPAQLRDAKLIQFIV